MTITIIALLVSIVFFVWGKIRSDLVAICALLSLVISTIITPQEAFAGFSNPVVVMMVCIFIVSGAIFRTGLTEIISRKILELAGTNQTRIYFLIMLVAGFIGAFVSNTGTVALMLPIAVSMATSAGISIRRFLMPLAFVSSMGGMLTLIGTPPNLVISNTLQEAGYGPLSFFSFLPVGLICVSFGIIVMLPLSKLLVEKKTDEKKQASLTHTSLNDLANEYQLSQNIFQIQVVNISPIVNKSLRELELPQRYAVSVTKIKKYQEKILFKKTEEEDFADPDTIVQVGDLLYVMGSFEQIELFVEENQLQLLEATTDTIAHDILRFDTLGIAKVVLLSTSSLIKALVKESKFRESYNCTILGIQRENNYILQNLAEEKLRVGDMLLVQGKWEDIARLNEKSSEWVLMDQPLKAASALTLDRKAPIAGLILIGMIALMVSNLVSTAVAAMVAALLMVLTGCFRNAEEAYKTINWESVVLIAAMLPMATAIEKTGITALIATGLATNLGSFGPTILLAGIYFSVSFLTLFISNTATAVLFAPIALQAAISMGVSPYPFLFAVTVSASMSFASPFSTAPNALVMSAGRYAFMDYIKMGVPLQIAYGILMTFALPFIFPF